MHTIRILIADDHVVLREGMRVLFENSPGFAVCGLAENGQQALDMTLEKKPCVVLLDVMMPIMDGAEVLKQIKTHSSTTKVLVFSAYSENEYILKMIQNGADGYLLKSSSKEAIIAAVRMVAAGGCVYDALISQKIMAMLNDWQQKAKLSKSIMPLSLREIEVLQAVAEGLSNKDIAVRLNLTLRTVKAHMSNIFSKLRVTSRSEAIIKSLKEGYIQYVL
ncbi:MAG: response regulator transcription factor [Chloroflexi bacterium]|nr:response regulator transcription factor [Chloroflexota bacterium]